MSSPGERIGEVGKKIKREADAGGDRTGGARRLGLVVARTLNTITPCAACKLLRRRCAQDCPFSPYFSPHEPQKFAFVHKVFGASNVSKMLMEVPEPHRADAANSLVYEANLRLRDPIYGCMGAISGLQQQVQALEEELQAVRAEILKRKSRQAAASGASGLVVPTSHAAAAASLDQVSLATAPLPPLLLSALDASTSSSSVYTFGLHHSSSASSYSSSFRSTTTFLRHSLVDDSFWDDASEQPSIWNKEKRYDEEEEKGKN